MKQYKLRAECLPDISSLLNEMHDGIHIAEITYVDGYSQYPDRELTFKSHLSLNEIRNRVRKISDSHVMLQTVQPIEKYTGERDYNLE